MKGRRTLLEEKFWKFKIKNEQKAEIVENIIFCENNGNFLSPKEMMKTLFLKENIMQFSSNKIINIAILS